MCLTAHTSGFYPSPKLKHLGSVDRCHAQSTLVAAGGLETETLQTQVCFLCHQANTLILANSANQSGESDSWNPLENLRTAAATAIVPLVTVLSDDMLNMCKIKTLIIGETHSGVLYLVFHLLTTCSSIFSNHCGLSSLSAFLVGGPEAYSIWSQLRQKECRSDKTHMHAKRKQRLHQRYVY